LYLLALHVNIAPHGKHGKDVVLIMLKELVLVAYTTNQSTNNRKLEDMKDNIAEEKMVVDGALNVCRRLRKEIGKHVGQ
jgi:hypothetical protein